MEPQIQQIGQESMNHQQGQEQIQPYFGHKIKLQKHENFDKLILTNDEIKDSINGIIFQIDKIIKTSSTDFSIKNQLKNINKMLNMINEDIKKNNEKIKNLYFASNNNNNINKEGEINIKNNNNTNEIIKSNVYSEINNNNNKNIISSSNIINNKEIIEKGKNPNLIKNIRSKLIFKLLFSYIHEKTKLKSIKYNKNLQSKISITLNNYKFYSGKYIIYETKGKGKEYSGHDDRLIFEGEYLNGEKNGKGKEYAHHLDNRYLLFEGEYKNGKRNGKGKEYEYGGEIIFEGEYINGKRYKGKEYFENGNLEFEGEYLNGKKWNGEGIEYNNEGEIIFEGVYLNGKKWNGKVKEKINNLTIL